MGGFPDRARRPSDAVAAETKLISSDLGKSDEAEGRSVVSLPTRDIAAFRECLRGATCADELLYPLSHAEWRGDHYRLKKGEAGNVRSRIHGVRFQPADPAREDLAPERQVQTDVGNLIAAVRRVREATGYETAILASKTLSSRPPRPAVGRRVEFGLDAGDRGRKDDVAAAAVSHRRLRSAIRKSGHVVVEPKAKFDAKTGMAGLEDWGRALVLRRRRRWWPWLLLLPLLALPFFCRDKLPKVSDFFGVSIETRSLVVVLDKSSSMAKHFDAVRGEARRVLTEMAKNVGEDHDDDAGYASLIVYDAEATSALGSLRKLDATARSEIETFLANLGAGGGTNLEAGLRLAAQEVTAHGRPTTLIILTDGEDQSIARMLADKPALVGAFADVEVRGHALTPRFFVDGIGDAASSTADSNPGNDHERRLHELATTLGGRFGPEGSAASNKSDASDRAASRSDRRREP